MTGNFSKTHLPELGAHLVAALARLDVNNLRRLVQRDLERATKDCTTNIKLSVYWNLNNGPCKIKGKGLHI